MQIGHGQSTHEQSHNFFDKLKKKMKYANIETVSVHVINRIKNLKI